MPRAVPAARSRRGWATVRVALAGKGGAGKTSIAATLARVLSRSGRSTVAVDADSNPNLAAALGIPSEQASAAVALPTTLLSRRLTGPALVVPVEEVLARH
ncbi:MAG: AAA family ATPase, partial [Actinophytocola sp.]|nr:AAA family ATPase [Actinophytocola sp.]